MQSKKPLYQPWNEEEFVADVFVRGLSHVQRWMYRTLLQASFFHTTRPYLPKDDRILWVLAGCESRAQWEENKEPILERFTIASHDANLLENKRVTADWVKLQDARERMSELGQRSAVARSTRSTDVQRSSHVTVLTVDGGAASKGIGIEKQEERESQSEDNGSVADVGSSDQEPQIPNMGGEWKNLAMAHKRYFGKKASVVFKERFFPACEKYTEAVVMECFHAWAPGAVEWVKTKNVDQPLHAFFKKLPDEAADAVDIAHAESEDAAKATQRAEQEKNDRERQERVQEASIAKEMAQNRERMLKSPPPQSEVDVLEFFSVYEAPTNAQPDVGSTDKMGADVQADS